MLERLVASVFRRATSLVSDCSSPTPMDMDASTSQAAACNNDQSEDEKDFKIDNSNLMAEKVSKLFDNHVMADVCLIVGDNHYQAHRLILCASSEVFKAMLTNSTWKEFYEETVKLEEEPGCSSVFEKFLRYLYTGQIKINQTTVMPILMLADKYIIKDLVTLCVDYMCNHVALAARNHQLIYWFNYTSNMKHLKACQACENFIKWNYELVSSGPDFVNFDFELLKRILKQSDLVVTDELIVFNGLVKWLKVQEEAQTLMLGPTQKRVIAANIEFFAEQTMKYIRFPMIRSRQLAQLLLSPISTLLKDFFFKRIALAMSFHSGGKEVVDDVCRSEVEGRLLFTPRLYTAENYCCTLNVENYSTIKAFFTHTLMFSSQTSLAEHVGERISDWVIDLYPKGVWFRKCYLIVWQGTVEVPEKVLRIVRVAVTCKDPPKEGVRVRVGLLMQGEQGGLKYVVAASQTVHRFTQGDAVLNLDGLLSFDDLNTPTGGRAPTSPLLIGPNRDTLKITFVIVPLSEISVSDI